MSITSLTVRGGTAPWVETVVEWTGVGSTWTLKDIPSNTTLYSGTALRYDMTSTPETIYRLRLTDDTAHTQDVSYVSPPISAPVELVATEIDSVNALLKWTPVQAATAYEVLVDELSYNVPPLAEVTPDNPLGLPSLFVGGLLPDRTYSAQIRAFMDTTGSLWSPVIYFTTLRITVAEASVYEYEPSAARTWTPTQGWLADGTPLIHGSGEAWGNTNGIHTTVFLYSADSLTSLRELAGVRVLAAQVSITRTVENSDPRMVMSHWLLHNMTTLPPVGAPPFVGDAMGVDSGQAALGQQVWMSVPTGWIDAMIANTAQGFGWGGASGRYMLGQPITDPVLPVNGTLRVTVG